MPMRNVDTPDNPAGAGFAPIQTKESRTVSGVPALTQIVDSWLDGEDTILLDSTVAGTSVSLGVLAPTVGFRPMWSWIVPAGKIFIADWLMAGASVTTFYGRLSRRHHLWAFSGAVIAAPGAIAAPSRVADANVGMGVGGYSYKITGINNVGETTPTAASATVTTLASTDAIALTLPAAAAGTRRMGLYRTLAGAPGGPWYFMHEVEVGHAAAYRDVMPDSQLDQARSPPVANGTAGSVQGVVPGNIVSSPLLIVQDVALAAAPSHMVYKNAQGLQRSVSIAGVATTVNTGTPVYLDRQPTWDPSVVIDAYAATKFARRGGDKDLGLTEVVTVSGNPATGQYNIYGHQPSQVTNHFGATAVQAAGQSVRWSQFRPVAYPAGAEIIVEGVVTQGAANTAGDFYVQVGGRLIAL